MDLGCILGSLVGGRYTLRVRHLSIAGNNLQAHSHTLSHLGAINRYQYCTGIFLEGGWKLVNLEDTNTGKLHINSTQIVARDED